MKFSAAFALFSLVWRADAHRSMRRHVHRNIPNIPSTPVPQVVKRDDTKYVFMHYLVGNTYSHTQDLWESDISSIQSMGIDAIALDMGSDDWQPDQVASAYAAASALGTDMKLFISLDFSSVSCDTTTAISLVSDYLSNSNQFMVDNQPMISSYSGECLGSDGWQTIKDSTGGYIMPFISGIEGEFDSWTALDSWLCWGCAFPQGDYSANTDSDEYYIEQLGTKYATTVGPWMFTHYSYKNFYHRGDDFLLNLRWEQLFGMRDNLTFVEMLTWNDYGESSYMGPLNGNQPTDTTWATDYSHTDWADMSKHYITAFKTGTYPSVDTDVIYYWARPHSKSAIATEDSLPSPTDGDWAVDYMWAAIFATADASVTLTIGDSTQTFDNVTAGVNTLRIPLATGQISVSMTRDGSTIIDKTDTNFTYTGDTTELYNFNAYVSSASSGDNSSSSSPSSAVVVSATGVAVSSAAAASSPASVSISTGDNSSPVVASSTDVALSSTYVTTSGLPLSLSGSLSSIAPITTGAALAAELSASASASYTVLASSSAVLSVTTTATASSVSSTSSSQACKRRMRRGRDLFALLDR